MSEKRKKITNFSRRDFIGTLAAGTAFTLVPLNFSCSGPTATTGTTGNTEASDKPNSNFGGVHIGAITYSFRSMPGGLENIIKYCRESGISSIELMSGDLEQFLGIPENPMRNRPRPAIVPGQPRPQRTPEEQAIIDKYNADVKEWRTSLPMSKVESAKKLMNDAGVFPHIVKFSPARWSDEEIEYAFNVTKAMGAKATTEEVGLESAKKLAPFAEKHGIVVGLHNHNQYAEEGFDIDPMLAVSPSIMLNFDPGHYFGSTGKHPNDFIRKYHDRIFSIHMKDKTGPTIEGEPNENQVWGQGEMPIADVLLLLKNEKWPIYVDIELEYPVKPWSNPVKEVRTCVQYARNILI